MERSFILFKATEILQKWEPIDSVDALELLTPQFTNRNVRQYAVSRLKQATDEVNYKSNRNCLQGGVQKETSSMRLVKSSSLSSL